MNSAPIRYVLGFAFSEELDEVLLIQKKRPLWQFGKLNGIGGKIEQDETPHQAMVREFKEETGLCSVEGDWRCVGNQTGSGFDVAVFCTVLDDDKYRAVQKPTDEDPVWFFVDDIGSLIVDKLGVEGTATFISFAHLVLSQPDVPQAILTVKHS